MGGLDCSLSSFQALISPSSSRLHPRWEGGLLSTAWLDHPNPPCPRWTVAKCEKERSLAGRPGHVQWDVLPLKGPKMMVLLSSSTLKGITIRPCACSWSVGGFAGLWGGCGVAWVRMEASNGAADPLPSRGLCSAGGGCSESALYRVKYLCGARRPPCEAIVPGTAKSFPTTTRGFNLRGFFFG